MSFSIQLYDTDPYSDIIVRSLQGHTIARFPQDDAPDSQWNIKQKKRAVALATMLQEKPI